MGLPVKLPHRGRGRQSAESEAVYKQSLTRFCTAIIEIRSRLDFQVSARGWCYILEEYGLPKGDFDRAQTLITQCRKEGFLPLDIVAEDTARAFQNLEDIDETDIEDEAQSIIDYVDQAHLHYTPQSFWEDQPCYIEMLVEKVDLKSLFHPICSQYRVPIANARGWSDLNSRAAMMKRFVRWEDQGKQCVLLYCGDHDPVGLQISDSLKSNLEDLAPAVGWHPENLIVDRFGLNLDFIEQQRLTWIDNLETGSRRRLDDPRHPDHAKPFVQNYLKRFGARKVEANALVVRPNAGRELCHQAITKYVAPGSVRAYESTLRDLREQVQVEVQRLVGVR